MRAEKYIQTSTILKCCDFCWEWWRWTGLEMWWRHDQMLQPLRDVWTMSKYLYFYLLQEDLTKLDLTLGSCRGSVVFALFINKWLYWWFFYNSSTPTKAPTHLFSDFNYFSIYCTHTMYVILHIHLCLHWLPCHPTNACPLIQICDFVPVI